MDFIDIHTHQKSTLKTVFSVENKYPNMVDFSNPFSIGIHPWYVMKDHLAQDFLILEEKLQDKNCVALGECGLDKVVKTDFELQKKVFQKQIELSEKYKKPLIIHCVKAFQEIIAFKKTFKPTQIWLIHGFCKNLQVAQSLLKNGFFLSFGATVINNKKLKEVVLEISTDRFFLETDTSDIKIQQIYQEIASIKKMTINDLQQTIKQNFTNIFTK